MATVIGNVERKTLCYGLSQETPRSGAEPVVFRIFCTSSEPCLLAVHPVSIAKCPFASVQLLVDDHQNGSDQSPGVTLYLEVSG